MLIGLQELKKSLESTVNTVDAESAARINQLSIAVDSAIKEVETAIKDASNQIQINEAKIFTDVFTVMSNVNFELNNKGYLAYIGVNATLANLATTAEGIPGIKIKPYLFATFPLRLSPNASDRMVSFYGHFRDVDDANPAMVTYRVDGLPEQKIDLKRYVGGSLAFQVPQPYLHESKFIEMSISIPEKKFFFFHGHTTFNTRVYVEALNAFSLKIDSYQENPNLWATIPSPTEHVERADSNRTSNVGTATAAQLFSTLINDNATYFADRATFAAMPSRTDTVGPPCWCGCAGSSAQMTSWDANSVSWQISAPSCGQHVCSKGGGFLGLPQVETCGGGGTHGEVYLRPTFKVKLRNQPADVLLNSASIAMKRNDVWQSKQLPIQWNSLSITGIFKDGDETHSCQATISKEISKSSCDLFSGSVTNNALTIQTR